MMKSLIVASAAIFGLALLTLPEPAAAQFSAKQKAACQGDAMRLYSQSLADPGQLTNRKRDARPGDTVSTRPETMRSQSRNALANSSAIN
jgi:hypothetical protein